MLIGGAVIGGATLVPAFWIFAVVIGASKISGNPMPFFDTFAIVAAIGSGIWLLIRKPKNMALFVGVIAGWLGMTAVCSSIFQTGGS